MAFSYTERALYSSPLDPTPGNVAVTSYWRAAYLGAPTAPNTPNQIQQITGLAASGIQNVEIGALDPRVWEAIPKQHFEEMRRLGKLVIRDFQKEGKPAPISVHAPILEPSGFSENKWSEELWREQQGIMADVVQKAAMLGPSTTVNIHAGHFPSRQIRYDPAAAKAELQKIFSTIPKEQLPAYKDEIERLQRGEILELEISVNPTTGDVQPLKREWVEYPEGPRLYTPERRLESLNKTLWDNTLKSAVAIQSELTHLQEALNQKIISEAEFNQRRAFWLEELGLAINSAFDSLVRSYQKFAESRPKEEAQKIMAGLNELRNEIAKAERENNLGRVFELLARVTPPQFVPVEDFGGRKAAEAFARMAMESVKAAKERKMPLDAAPVVSIENVDPSTLGGRSESLRRIVEQSREIFASSLEKEMKMKPEEAKKLAEKLIGATWDIGHMNILRRYGYSPEKLKEEIQKIAQDIKHVHLTDNFGFSDVHLPPGMGNVDFDSLKKILAKEGKLGQIKAIVEAGGWVQHFKESPWPYTLLNLPAYGWQAPPSWQGIGSYFIGTSGYAAGYGTIFPEIHASEYGIGFSTGLPPLRMPGKGERSTFSGTPMS